MLVDKIVPTYENAFKFAASTQIDMEASYERVREQGTTFTDAEQEVIDEAIAAVTPERVLQNLREKEGEYFYARHFGKAAAYLHLGKWSLGDRIAYEPSPQRQKVYGAFRRIAIVNTFRAPMGIFSLVGAEGAHEMVQQTGMNELVQLAVEKAGNRDIYIGASVGDPAIGVLEDNIFHKTDFTAREMQNVPALQQTLYIRESNP